MVVPEVIGHLLLQVNYQVCINGRKPWAPVILGRYSFVLAELSREPHLFKANDKMALVLISFPKSGCQLQGRHRAVPAFKVPVGERQRTTGKLMLAYYPVPDIQLLFQRRMSAGNVMTPVDCLTGLY